MYAAEVAKIKLPYYIDCGEPSKRAGESTENAWKRCADVLDCAETCMMNYYERYRSQCDGLGMSNCEVFARNHNGGPSGCRNQGTSGYWQSIQRCIGGEL